MSNQERKYALILGSSSGFGAATAIRLAKDGYNIFGVHLDRRATMPLVEEVISKIKGYEREAVFHNANAADEEKRKEITADIRQRVPEGEYINVLMHSLAFGTLKPIIEKEPNNALNKSNVEMTLDVMANSLIYWVQELHWNNLLGHGSRVFAMTSHGSTNAVNQYGAVSAAKAALEAYIRQLALELKDVGATANAIKAGVTDTPALRKIPDHDSMIRTALARNPAGRLTTPEDVANAISALSSIDAQWINGDIIAVDNAENFIDG
jgi:NAD(P)-dependent dehydrogenase (short-subunit alcohol dehydrogenase family)